MSTNWDLLLVTDSTASMGTYLLGLAAAIPEILALGALSGAFKRVGLLAYMDYDQGPEAKDVIEWFGWDNPQIHSGARGLTARGGGDVPEAAKTCIVEFLKHVDPERKTIVLWYADAGPHHSTNSRGYYANGPKERAALEGEEIDWVKLSKQANSKNCTIFPIIQDHMAVDPSRFFAVLASLTGGMVFTTTAESSETISLLTLDILLTWMGEKPSSFQHKTELLQFEVSPAKAEPPIEDEEKLSRGYLPNLDKTIKKKNLTRIKIDSLQDAPFLIENQLPNLPKRYLDPEEKEYRKTVCESLQTIISKNVIALTYNPVFGQLWRAVCKERNNPNRDLLVNAFSSKVGKETDEKRRQQLTDWLEESYNSEAEILEIIEAAPDHGHPDQRRIYLDLDSGVNLTRVELLEVSRSLYPGVLQKLASILTHLKVVEKDVVLLPSQRSIPLSLTPFNLFKILPHLVVSGTMFSVRAAALFAALSMVVGVPFLDEPARELLNQQKGTWLDIDTPENLSYECAKLLLRLPEDVGLTKEERGVYAGMRRYRLIELNMQAPLSAIVPWTPEKATGVGDLQITCKLCNKKRSVTIMATDDDICGFCAWERDRLAAIAKRVPGSKHLPVVDVSTEPEPSVEQVRWYECSMSSCKAQYVILGRLGVRPKCHYCRTGLECPWVACEKCSSRIIIPERYRGQFKGPFNCFACQAGKKTLVEEETSTKELIKENGSGWLGFDSTQELFKNSTAFKLFSKYGPAVFSGVPSDKALMLNHKKIHNFDAIRLKIEGRVATGEVEEGTCELCFNDISHEKLFPACGRTGCSQRVDEECLKRWYGENKPGKLLNPLQLACPFCRRTPVTKILAKYNPPALSVGDLSNAINDRAWYYAWCTTCGFAKRAVERACADAGLPNIRDFFCQQCRADARALEARLLAEAEALREQQRQATRPRQHERLQREQLIQQERGLVQERLEELTRWIKLIKSERVIKIQACPRCKVAVEKSSGCNHITCICGAHFCFIDGLEFPPDEIYKHLSKKHGGYGFEEGFDDEDDY